MKAIVAMESKMDILIGKTGGKVSVDVDNLPKNTVEYVVRYGLTQILNDVHSSVTRTDYPDDAARAAKVDELVAKKLAALTSGDVRMHGGRVGDPVKAAALRLAEGIVKAAIAAKGRKLKEFDTRAMAETYLGSHPELMNAARDAVTAAREAADDVDLD